MKKSLTILITALLISPLTGTAAPEQGDAKCSVAPKVPIEVYAFNLADVRLMDGPFRKAMDIDAKYLLELKPDRLLSRFREYAGLKPKGKVYGGWEGRGLSGHTLSHYISTCSMMSAASGDKRFADRVNYIVNELAECQKAHDQRDGQPRLRFRRRQRRRRQRGRHDKQQNRPASRRAD